MKNKKLYKDLVKILRKNLDQPNVNYYVAKMIISIWEEMMLKLGYNFDDDIVEAYIFLKGKLKNTAAKDVLKLFLMF